MRLALDQARNLFWLDFFMLSAGMTLTHFGIDVAVSRRHTGVAGVVSYVLFWSMFHVLRNAGMP